MNSEQVNQIIPESWLWTDLDNISVLVTGKTPSTIVDEYWNGSIPFVTPSQIKASGTMLPSQRNLTILGSEKARIIPENSILIVCIGSVGKIGLLDKPSVINQQLNALIPIDPLIPKFLYYWSKYFLQSWVIENASATVNAAILNKSRLGKAPIPLPPLNEQRRIVSTIEQLTDRSHKARAALEDVPKLIAQFRQSVLAAAFRGDLTADWREKNPDIEPASELLERIKIEKDLADSKSSRRSPSKPQDLEMPDFQIPESWEKVLSHDLLAFVTSGSRGWAKYYSDSGDIFIRVGNLDRNTISLDLTDIQRVNISNDTEGVRSKIFSGDILVSVTADIGMIGIVDDELGEAYISQHVALARPFAGFSKDYLAWYLASHSDGYQQFQKLQRGATKTGLGLDDIRSIWIPFPPLAEQAAIVSAIKSHFRTIEKIREQYLSAQADFNVLDRSILAKAFRGELVPQDPNDESAAVLLDRIRAEREQTSISQQRGKTTRKNSSKQLSIEGIE